MTSFGAVAAHATTTAATVLAWALLASPAAAVAAGRCPVLGEPLHWIVDYCMLTLETDDEIAASSCIEQEGKRRWRSACASNSHYKKRMCEVMVRSGTRSDTVDQCVRDPSFKGRTVERGGVGG
ncbi:hypothetical protein RAMLITH_10690 [Ramlibacter sp. RBP-2]|uniref:Uncharacterized protein n=1 Tax=Ramlibacter lithotrophicus TaxID=2606681 RepID=A0A7X6DFX2_9BURK|nr:hypothetical protein [Ramlibacter lithotrophicus]NKE66288.1 hypothetical protein [Ramlibacter lithotrophicus]